MIIIITNQVSLSKLSTTIIKSYCTKILYHILQQRI